MGAPYTAAVDWIQHHLLTCPSRKYLHMDCPGCGFQRSVVALLRGNLGQSFSLYPATLPLLILFCVTLLHLKWKFSRGAEAIIFLQSFSAIVILVFYIYKIITHKIAA